MNKNNILILVLLIGGLSLSSCRNNTNVSSSSNEPPTLRVAWMTSWATTGQVVESLIHTDILEKQGIKVEFKKFLFGPPMNEAALAGDVDVTIVGDMPAIILLARSDKWSVVSRTIYFPYGLLVRSDVEAQTISDLKGKTIGVPFGSGPQPTLYRWLEEAGLKINSDVKVINLLPNEMAEAIQSKRVEAIMTWEPTMTILKNKNLVRVIKEAKGVGFMCMSNKFIDQYPEVVNKFVNAWKEALFYAGKHDKEVNQLFSIDSKFPTDLLDDIHVIDDNFQAQSLNDISVRLTTEDIKKNQIKADFSFDQKLITKRIDLKKLVRQNLIKIKKEPEFQLQN